MDEWLPLASSIFDDTDINSIHLRKSIQTVEFNSRMSANICFFLVHNPNCQKKNGLFQAPNGTDVTIFTKYTKKHLFRRLRHRHGTDKCKREVQNRCDNFVNEDIIII